MKEVKLGIVGLGRIGKSHAQNLLNTIGSRVTAVCSIVSDELTWAKEHIPNVAVFEDYDEMLAKADIDAVFLATTTAVHAEQIVKGFEAGKHVFCEKPLGISAQECRKVSETIRAFSKEKVFMMGFVRRFDPAYSFAKKQIDEGVIGEPFMVRAQTADHDDFADFQVKFVQTGGGIFHDMNVHDIDLARWYLGVEPVRVYAVGSSFVHPAFDEIGDADNATVSCECEQGKLAFISACRTAFHGHDTRAEILGTEGILRVGFTPQVTDVEILDKHGQRVKCVYTFFDRFSEAFRIEAQTFVNCVLGKESSIISIDDALQATVIAEAFTKSFKEKRPVTLDEV